MRCPWNKSRSGPSPKKTRFDKNAGGVLPPEGAGTTGRTEGDRNVWLDKALFGSLDHRVELKGAPRRRRRGSVGTPRMAEGPVDTTPEAY